ncbi:hypothetical protein MKX01_036345 [Papaver californicum]|nr:hypothetical protein MKX01_036345 [Papaver californicum]
MAENCCLSTTLVVLPEDVIFQILIRLPVQSLLRFRSVSTSWYALIQSSSFIQSHATTAVDDNSKLGGTFICQQQTGAPAPQFYLLSDQLEGFKELEDLGKQPCFKDVRRPYAINMVDSVHGIVCLYNSITRDIVLWNPATRQCRLLPKSVDGNPKDRYEHHDFVGLGFDFETKDYKVIQVSSLVPRKQDGLGLNIPRTVQIYCRTSDSWRLIASDFPIHCCCLAFGRSLNGIYFHLGVDYTTAANTSSVILSFDLSKEKYTRVIKTPEDNFHHLVSVGDKLACITATRGCYGLYKVWMYDDDTTLWTELYSVEPWTNVCGSMLTISWNGKFGLFGGETLTCYNSVTNKFEDLGFGEGIGSNLLTWADIFKETLVSVDATTKAISSSYS